jgi:hypothetical protein
MSGSNYSGARPIKHLWVLDDGGELRFYLSDQALSTAVLNGYAWSAESTYKKRPASLQYFSERGVADCSAFIDLVVPLRDPHPDQHGDAFEKWRRGDTAAWQDLLDTAKARHQDDKKRLTKRIAAYRDAVISATTLPPANPWLHPDNRGPATPATALNITESETA